MDACLPNWNTEDRFECPVPTPRKPLGLDNELVELLWQNGGVVLNTQTNSRKNSKNPTDLIRDYGTIPWIDDCPIDESFEKEFYSNLLSEIPPPNPGVKSDDHNLQPPAAVIEQSPIDECSVRTINSSHCESNQVVTHDVDMSWASSSYGVGGGSKAASLGVGVKYGRNVSPPYQSTTDKETLGQGFTSCSGGSGSSSFWNQSNEINTRKRKTRDAEESECRSDATGLDSAAGNKSSQKPGTTRRSRVAEVHNMSERRRRDRINERMKALQELIPHSNKSDKASMLDEAIEYMKSLQWQLQMMWMGSGMAPMMVPGMQHYMSRFGMGMGPPMHPGIQNLMRLSRLPRVDQAINMAARTNQALVNYQNQVQNYMGFHSAPNSLQQTNMFPFGFHSAQQNMVLPPPDNGNGSHGS